MKLIAASLGVAGLAVLAGIALQQGRADLLAYQGRAVLRGDEIVRTSLSPGDWRLAQHRLEQALGLAGPNPALAEDLGRLHESRTRRSAGSDAKAELDLSLQYLRRSLQARPTSPYTWANLAFVKSRLGVLDDEFYRSMQNAALLGPWEPEVQLLLADIGFRYWRRMPKPAQDLVHAAIQRGLKRQDEKLFNLATGYGRLDVMCATPGIVRSKRAVRCI